MDFYLLILRLIHILSAVFWAGGVIHLAMFIMPSVNTSMPEGGKVMQRLIAGYHFPTYMATAGALTVLSGLMMYDNLSRHFSTEWIGSSHGLCLTIGALSAITAFLLGILINKPRADKMGRIGKEIMQAGGKPTEVQIAKMTALRMGITSLTKVMAVLVLVAVICMAAAKYVN
jgi:hypothetical protein